MQQFNLIFIIYRELFEAPYISVVNRQQKILVFLSNERQLYKITLMDHKRTNLKLKNY